MILKVGTRITKNRHVMPSRALAVLVSFSDSIVHAHDTKAAKTVL